MAALTKLEMASGIKRKEKIKKGNKIKILLPRQ